MSTQRLYTLTDTIIVRSFYLLFFLVPLIFISSNFELFEFPKMLATYALTVVIVAAWSAKSILAGRLIFRRTLLDLPLLLFLLSQILSTFYSLDPHTSIWGYYSRSHGGLLSTTSYLLLYWAYVSNMTLRTTHYALRYLLSSATIVAVWGIFEHFGKSPSCLILRGNFDTSCWIQDAQARVFATLGQPNWMAAYLTALAPLGWALALNSKIKMQNAKWLVINVLFFAALLFTKSRSGLLGFEGAYVVFWAISFLHLNKQILRPFLLLTTSYLLLLAIFGSPLTPTSLERRAPNTAIKAEGGTVLEQGGTESGEIRKIVWKGAINIWKAHPIFGSGVETFAYSYYQFRSVEHNLTSEWDFLYNKAHNEYLNFLSTTGMVGLFTYFLVIVTTIWTFLRKIDLTNYTNKLLKTRNGFREYSRKIRDIRDINGNTLLLVGLLSGYVSILVTNFFGFSVVATSTLFFLFPAMALIVDNRAKNMEQGLPEHRGARQISAGQMALIIFVLVSMVYGLFTIGKIWYADTLYAKATELNNAGESLSAVEVAEKAVKVRPDEPVYYNELAKGLGHSAVSLAGNGDTTQAEVLAKRAIEAQDRAVTVSPLNLNFLKARSALFFDLTSVDPKYLEDSALTLEKAVEIAPTEPKVFYNLGVIYDRLGKTKEAQEVFERALELKPNYEDAKVALREIEEQLP